jgi:DNA-binding MurR/RpiR family transcriptional regulator
MQKDLFLKIKDLEGRLNGKQKRLAEYFLTNFEGISFQTVQDIANKTKISEATIVRFSRTLGFTGFSQLRDEIQKILLKKLSPFERFHTSSGGFNNIERLVASVFEREMNNLREAQGKLQLTNIERIANLIIKAKRKYIVGFRATGGCAYLLGYYLNYILPDVLTMHEGDSSVFEKLKSINDQDVLVAISYPRYTRSTVEVLKFAKDRKSPTVCITDSELSPATKVSDFTLFAPANSSNFANSYTACSTVINLLITLISHMDTKRTEIMLKEMDKVLNSFNLFYKSRP